MSSTETSQIFPQEITSPLAIWTDEKFTTTTSTTDKYFCKVSFILRPTNALWLLILGHNYTYLPAWIGRPLDWLLDTILNTKNAFLDLEKRSFSDRPLTPTDFISNIWNLPVLLIIVSCQLWSCLLLLLPCCAVSFFVCTMNNTHDDSTSGSINPQEVDVGAIAFILGRYPHM